jgi:ABC-2 type transport system ATP-binding protein
VPSDLIIKTSNLTKIFWKKSSEGSRFTDKKKERIVAIDHPNPEMNGGEIFDLLGSNGAGKTTTIKMLCTPRRKDEGTAVVKGLDVVTDDGVRKKYGVVLGGGRALYWRLSGQENLRFFCQMYNVPFDIAKKGIQELPEPVELDKSAYHAVEKYSRGMKARLHIARDHVNNPDILLLDEPTLRIDPSEAKMLTDLIKNEPRRKRGKTILLTTHYVQEAGELRDRVAIINKGQIIALRAPRG